MSTNLSVAEILANLEKKLAFHREQEAFHIQQEAHHREQRGVHTAEIENVAQHLEAFKKVALPAAELATPPPAPPPPEETDLGPRPLLSKLITRVAVSWPPGGETMTPTSVAAEVNRRYPTKLKRRVDARLASVTLRRLRDSGQLHLVREGKAHHEAVYSKDVLSSR
ncbi:MAG: hypothetical protein QOF89_5581 [Acidobacteriota bacterium]|jgi:hypothetical protein|nr:hypothetical protein [Acidobacteriota bacterium]